MSRSAHGLSLWLVPAEPERSRCAELIDALAAELASPRFDPHVTLLGGLELADDEVTRRAGALAAALPALDLELAGLAGGTEYFRFFHAEVAPSEALLEARRRAAAAFALPAGGFRPHLSLAYAEPDRHDAAALCRRLAGRVSSPIRCPTLSVVRTSGPPGDWAERASFRLGR